MNVNDLCATSPDVKQPMEIDDSTSEHSNVVKDETANSTALTNTTNTTPTSYYNNTLPPLSQQQFPKQHLPSLVELPSTYGSSVEDTTMTETTDTGDTGDMKKLIDKCTNLCHNLARYKTLQKDYSEEDQEATFDYITHTTYDILDSLVAMQQQCEAAVLNEAEYTMIRQARNWKENRKPKYRRRSKRSIIGQRCHSCHTSETPEWRRGPDGARTLCNACGLHYSKLLRKESVTVSQYKHLTNGTSNSDIKLLKQQPHDLRQQYSRIQAPHHPKQPFQSPIPPLSSSTDASTSSTSSPPSSASTNTTSSSSSSSSSSQPTTITSSHRPSLYHITH